MTLMGFSEAISLEESQLRELKLKLEALQFFEAELVMIVVWAEKVM